MTPTSPILQAAALLPALKALRIDYRGFPINAVDPTGDRMYVAIEDTAGNVSVYPNPDADAAKAADWTSWYTKLSDINVVGNTNLNAISGFAIGFGVRCECLGDYPGGTGNVMFDNIRLYAPTCIPLYRPTADIEPMDGDCAVDIKDLDFLATDWLKKAGTCTFPVTPPATLPVLWYKFDDTGPTCTIADSGASTNPDRPAEGYTGTVSRSYGEPPVVAPECAPLNWDATGGRSVDHPRCFYIPGTLESGSNPIFQYFVKCDTNALDFMNDDAHSADNGGGGISFAVWINAELSANQFLVQWCGLFNITATGDILEVPCPDKYACGQHYAILRLHLLEPGLELLQYLPFSQLAAYRLWRPLEPLCLRQGTRQSNYLL